MVVGAIDETGQMDVARRMSASTWLGSGWPWTGAVLCQVTWKSVLAQYSAPQIRSDSQLGALAYRPPNISASRKWTRRGGTLSRPPLYAPSAFSRSERHMRTRRPVWSRSYPRSWMNFDMIP